MEVLIVDRTIPGNVLDDLCSRFIINVPEEERTDLIRLCFQIELAHWFYIDFYCKNGKKTIGIKEFALYIFQHIPSLHQYVSNVDKIIEEWKEYKYLVPTFGAILLDEDLSHVLLVQSYYSKSSWGFPKGKVNKDEPPWVCAIREVYEETGFNIKELIDPNEYLDARVNEQLVRLYIIPGVSRVSKFQPQTRNEIKSVEWFPISGLPASKKDAGYRVKNNNGTESFYMVGPFIRRIRQWIFDQKNKPRKQRRPRHNSCGDIDNLGTKDYPTTKYLKSVKDDKNKAMNELGFKTVSQGSSTSPSEEETRNNSPECKEKLASDFEKLYQMFPKLSQSDKKEYRKEFNLRRNSSELEYKEKPKSIELSTFLKAFEQMGRSASVPPNEKPKQKHVRRKMEFDCSLDCQLIPISEADKPRSNIPLKFNEIPLSESIANNGIYNWCNFKFDLQSILKSIDEVKI